MWEKILVAVDLSPIATIVFKQALTLAKSTRTTLILLHVLSLDQSPTKPLLYSDEYPTIPDVYQRKEWEAFQKKGFAALEAMKNEAIKQDVNTEIMQVFGSPGRIICDRAKKSAVDLIIIGNRGLSGLKELVLGSVSNYVIHHASSSVLIVRNPNQ